MSNGSQVGSIVGGVVGGIAGAMVGMPALGFSIGWAAGGIIGGVLDPPDPQITDMGTQAFPPFNTALRGLTVPVLFGTNRVSSQIVWQGNSQIIRNEKTEGGGGGSGGGPKQTTVSYNYKLDLIYHLGMSNVPLTLYNGWETSGKKLTGTTIAAIQKQYGDNYTPGVMFSSDAADSASLTFDSAVFFPGNHPEPATWPNLTSSVGAPVRWPGTLWVGFGGLDLGTTPNIPQLSWEVGTAQDVSFDVTDSVIAHSSTLDSGDDWIATAEPDKHGNVWSINYGAYDINPKVYSGTTGALLASHVVMPPALSTPDIENGTTWYEIVTRQFNLDTAAGLVRGVEWEPYSGYAVMVTPDKERIVFTCYARMNIFAGNERRIWASGEPQPDGTIIWRGACLQTSRFVDVGFYGNMMIDIGGLKTRDDNIIIAASAGFNSSFRILMGPTPNQIESVFNYGVQLDANPVVFQNPDTAQYFGQLWSLGGTNGNQESQQKFFCLPGPQGETMMFGYLNKSDKADYDSGVYNPWIRDVWVPARPNGGLFRFNYPLDVTRPSAGTSWNQIEMGDPIIMDTPFREKDFTLTHYIADDGLDYATTTTTSGVSGNFLNVPTIERLPNGAYLVTFAMPYRDDPSYTGTDSSVKLKLIMYNYNPLSWLLEPEGTGVFQELAKIKGPVFALPNIGKDAPPSDWATDYFSVYVERINEKLIVYSGFGPAGASYLGSHWVKSEFADFRLGGGGDLTPPEIIYQILVNTYFGMYPGADIIDEISYADAVQYCEAHDIKVSTVYRNDETAQRLIELLLAVYSGFLVVDAAMGKIKFGLQDRNNVPVRTLDNNHILRLSPDSLPVKTTKGARQDTFNLIRINYIDRSIDYKANQIELGDEVDQDLNGVRLRDFPGQFVMSQATAQRMASRALWDNLYTRDVHTFAVGWRDCDLEPGDLVTVVDSFSNINQVVRINRMKETSRGIFEINATQQLTYIPGLAPSDISSVSWEAILYADVYDSYTNTSSPTNNTIPSYTPQPPNHTAYELPPEFEVSATGKVYVSWYSPGAAGANLYLSADGTSYVLAEQVTPYQIAGRLVTPLPADSSIANDVIIDLSTAYDWSVTTPKYALNTTLADANEATMHAGGALLLVGSEMLGYHTVTLVSQNRYKLGSVYRGWGGTPVAVHAAGDIFYRHATGYFSREYGADQIGTTFWYKVAPLGFNGTQTDLSLIPGTSYTITGRAVRPAIPATPQYLANRGITRVNAGGEVDIPISWAPTARNSGFGSGGAGTNPGGWGGFVADSLGWRVNVVGSGGLVVRSTYVNTPAYTYESAANSADNSGWRGDVAFQVTPRNNYGDAPATATLSMELFY